METERFFLYWDYHELYVHEHRKNIILVDAIIRGIEAGDRFEPIEVLKLPNKRFGENAFCLNQDGSGGHHRALGHYIVGKPLPCIWLKEAWRLEVPVFPIGQVQLFDHREIMPESARQEYSQVFLRRSKRYRRLDYDGWKLERQ